MADDQILNGMRIVCSGAQTDGTNANALRASKTAAMANNAVRIKGHRRIRPAARKCINAAQTGQDMAAMNDGHDRGHQAIRASAARAISSPAPKKRYQSRTAENDRQMEERG